jgi:hypothetical protein
MAMAPVTQETVQSTWDTVFDLPGLAVVKKSDNRQQTEQTARIAFREARERPRFTSFRRWLAFGSSRGSFVIHDSLQGLDKMNYFVYYRTPCSRRRTARRGVFLPEK